MEATGKEMVDDPPYNMRNCCLRLMQALADQDRNVAHPAEWDSASGIEDYALLDPNDPIRISQYSINRDSLHL